MHSMLFGGGGRGIWKISFRNRRKEKYVLKITDLDVEKEKVSNTSYLACFSDAREEFIFSMVSSEWSELNGMRDVGCVRCE